MKTPKIFKKRKTPLHKICVSRVICDHLVGDKHSQSHRYVVGTVIMSLGVGLTQVVFFWEATAIHIIGDIIGYGVHGLGAVPFIDKFISSSKQPLEAPPEVKETKTLSSKKVEQ